MSFIGSVKHKVKYRSAHLCGEVRVSGGDCCCRSACVANIPCLSKSVLCRMLKIGHRASKWVRFT